MCTNADHNLHSFSGMSQTVFFLNGIDSPMLKYNFLTVFCRSFKRPQIYAYEIQFFQGKGYNSIRIL